MIYNPVRDDWHVAVRGQGAFFNGRRARVGGQTRLGEVMVGVGFYYDRGVMMESTLAAIGDLKRDHQIHGIRRFGAATLDLCMVALGQLGAYFEYTLSPWDFAAGRLFVEEAGGRVTTCLGDPLPLAKSSILATNGHLHDAMLDVVRPRYPFERSSRFRRAGHAMVSPHETRPYRSRAGYRCSKKPAQTNPGAQFFLTSLRHVRRIRSVPIGIL